jgi:hypothetical protein
MGVAIPKIPSDTIEVEMARAKARQAKAGWRQSDVCCLLSLHSVEVLRPLQLG